MKKLIYKDNKKRTTVHNFEKKKKFYLVFLKTIVCLFSLDGML